MARHPPALQRRYPDREAACNSNDGDNGKHYLARQPKAWRPRPEQPRAPCHPIPPFGGPNGETLDRSEPSTPLPVAAISMAVVPNRPASCDGFAIKFWPSDNDMSCAMSIAADDGVALFVLAMPLLMTAPATVPAGPPKAARATAPACPISPPLVA